MRRASMIGRFLVATVVAGGLFGGARMAAAQEKSDDGHRARPPIRASATVEVIDPARGVDEIFSRIRDQKNRRSDGSKERTTGSDDDSRRTNGSGSTASTNTSSSGNSAAGNGGDRDTLPPPDKTDRPSFRPDRDRRDPRRQDSDSRPTVPNDRPRTTQTQTRH